MRYVQILCLVLTIVGAANWGLWGLFQFDLVAALLDGQTGPLSRVIYSVVGLAGLILAGTSLVSAGAVAHGPHHAPSRGV